MKKSTLTTVQVYQNDTLTLHEQYVEMPDGQRRTVAIIEKPQFAVIIPYEQGQLYLVKQFRETINQNCWELPQAVLEKGSGGKEEAFPAVSEKLSNLTGLADAKIKQVGFLYDSYTYSNQGFYIYLAWDFQKQLSTLAPELGQPELMKCSFEEFEKMIQTGEIKDAPSVSAYTTWITQEMKRAR